MDIYLFNSFIKLVEKENFSQAAIELNMTQPTLSQQIHKLEKELDVKLIDRTTRSFVVTEAGEEVLKFARQLIDIDNEMRKKIEPFKSLNKTLKIGILPTLGKMNLTNPIFDFFENKNRIDMKLFEDFSFNLYKSLLRRKYDLIIANKITWPWKESYVIEETLLRKGRLVVVCGEEHKFAKLKAVTLEDCAQEPIIKLHSKASVSISIDKEFKKHKLKQNVICSCETTSNMISLVNENYGISFLSDKIAQAYATPKTRIVKLLSRIPLDIVICNLKENSSRPLIKEFIKYLMDSNSDLT